MNIVFGKPEIFTMMLTDSWMYNSNDTIPRYVENPEWKKENINRQITLNNKIIKEHEERILELKDENKKLKKDLESLE